MSLLQLPASIKVTTGNKGHNDFLLGKHITMGEKVLIVLWVCFYFTNTLALQ